MDSGRFKGASREFRDAATHETLSEVAKKLPADPMSEARKVSVSVEAEGSQVYRPQGIIARSDILNRSGFCVLVPKRAVLHLPDQYQGSLGLNPGTKIVHWQEFFANNRSWIRTLEVTRNQAEGLEPLSEDVVKRFTGCDQVVVATYQGGPISVLPLQEEKIEDAVAVE